MREARQMEIEYVAPKRKEEIRPSARTDFDRKFWAAMAMFAALAALVWFTMDAGSVLVFGRPVELRLIPLILIGALALRTVLARQAEKIRRQGEKN
ncbi:hypothetical protein SBA5_470103 [Candidatus Sulfotelmatomonas gaucii]|uniref:Uncharacterized protein n=1 Tax=Candidatus Sulfuritelmatomonas gaucii TaxID=2043161 RepID=A0A2N9LP22_9BACT|nr:hypothetical protein SBA5_470103 [Candidatus Sulfotelmatomonas gaucii]